MNEENSKIESATKNNIWFIISIIFLIIFFILFLVILFKIRTPEQIVTKIGKILVNDSFLASIVGASLAGGFSIYVLREQSRQNQQIFDSQIEASRNQFNNQNKIEFEKVKFDLNVKNLDKLREMIYSYLQNILDSQRNEIQKLYLMQKYIQENNVIFTDETAVEFWKQVYENVNKTIGDMRNLQNTATFVSINNSDYIKKAIIYVFDLNGNFCKLDSKINEILKITRDEIEDKQITQFSQKEYNEITELFGKVAKELSNLSTYKIPLEIEKEFKHFNDLL